MSARALHVLAALLVPWAAAHPAHSAIRLASSGLRLRDGAAAHGATLSLRGGGAVPGVEWSQRQGSLMVKVEIPAGASFDDLHLAGDDDVIEWADDKVSLSLGLYGKLDKDSLAKKHCGRHVTLNAKKLDQAWWPKLTKGPKPGNVKVDWASWKDEDEAETEKYSKTSVGGADDDFDFGSMGAGGGMDGDMDDIKAPTADATPSKWVDMDDDGDQEGEDDGADDDKVQELSDDKPENEDLPDAQDA